MAKPGSEAFQSVMVIFHFEKDISFLFPYINAVAKEAELYDKPNLIRFVYDKVHCVLYPKQCLATPLNDREHGKEFRDRIIEFLNGILEKKNEIIPKYKIFQKVPVTHIIKLLPTTNCGECGFSTCMAFASMLSKQQAQPAKCPYIGLPINEQVTYPLVDNNGSPVSSVTLNVDTFNHKEILPEEDEVPSVNASIIKTANDSLQFALSKRELQVLSLMGAGKTNRDISGELFISPHTVKSHVINIFNKLGVNHRTQAVVWAVRHQLI